MADCNVEVIRWGMPRNNDSYFIQTKGRPKAVMAYATRDEQLDGDGATHYALGMGFADGTRQYGMSFGGTDNGNGSGYSATQRVTTNDHILPLIYSAVEMEVERSVAVESFHDDGFWVTVDETTTKLSHAILFVVFNGADVEAYAGVKDMANTTVDMSESVTDPGFRPDLLFVYCPNRASSTDAGFFLNYSFGAAAADKQFGIWGRHNNNSPDNTGTLIMTDDRIMGINPPSGISWRMEFGGFTDEGFDVVPRTRDLDQAEDDGRFGYLALKLGVPLSLVNHLSPTSPGTQDYDDLGARPQCVMVFSTFVDGAFDEMTHQLSGGTSSPKPDALSIGIMHEDTLADCVAVNRWVGDASAPAPGDSNSHGTSKVVSIYTGSGDSLSLEAEPVSFNDDGHTLDWTQENGTARNLWSLSIGRNTTAECCKPRLIRSWIDARDPGRGLRPLAPNTDCTSAMQAILDEYTKKRPLDGAAGLFIPVGEYNIHTTVDAPAAGDARTSGLLIQGGGAMAKGQDHVKDGHGVYTLFRWRGDSAGPMFDLNSRDGFLWDRIVFDGIIGPDTAGTGGDGLAVLIRMPGSSTGGSGQLFHEFRNCGFYRAERLFHSQDGSATAGPAEITFTKCLFDCGENLEVANNWTSEAFFADSNQTVNTLFQNCEFNNCGRLAVHNRVGMNYSGRTIFRDMTIANCNLILDLFGGGFDNAGHIIDGAHIDMQSGRCNWVRMRDRNGTYGAISVRSLRPGQEAMGNPQNVEIDSYNSTTQEIVLLGDLAIAPGDRIAFTRKDDVEVWVAEAAVFQRTDDRNLLLDPDPPFGETHPKDLTPDMGKTFEQTFNACYGEPLLLLRGKGITHVQDCLLQNTQVYARGCSQLQGRSGASDGQAALFMEACALEAAVDPTSDVPNYFFIDTNGHIKLKQIYLQSSDGQPFDKIIT